ISVYDLQRETRTQITFSGTNFRPAWTPDGKHIVYDSRPGTDFAIRWNRADGAGEPQQLLGSKTNMLPYSFSPDGRQLAYSTISSNGGLDIWILPLDTTDPDHPKPERPEIFLGTPANETDPAFSPDGHWIAYASDDSGSRVFETYVRPFRQEGTSSTGRW